MKVLTLSCLVILISFEFCELKTAKDIRSLSMAIKNITNVLFESSGELATVWLTDDVETLETKSMILKIVKDKQTPYSVTNIKYNKPPCLSNEELEKSASLKYLELKSFIMFLSSFHELFLFFEARDRDQARHQLSAFLKGKNQKTFLIYVHAFNSNLDSLNQIKEELRLTENLYFLVEDQNFITLKTFVWFTPGQCRIANLIEINRFSKTDNVWQNSMFKIEKFRNLNGCDVPVLRTTLKTDTKRKNKIQLYAVKVLRRRSFIKLFHSANPEQKLIQTLLTHLNFKKLQKEPANEQSRRIDGPTKFRVDFTLFELNDRDNGSLFRDSYLTQPHVYQSIYFGVPVGAEYNGYQKLALPFDDDVWILILLTFFVTFITIFVTSFFQVNIRNFIIGPNISTPHLNATMIVFGIGQTTLPGRNFARFLTMIFILYCLIMRTAWQGKMFEFMQKDMRGPEVKSIEEMIEKNFTFHLEKIEERSLNGSDFAARAKISFESFDDILNKYTKDVLANPDFKGVLQVLPEVLSFQTLATNGSILNRFVNQQFRTRMWSFRQKRNFLIDVLNDKLLQLTESGIIEFYGREYKVFLNYKRYEHLHPEGPEVLTMEHLEAGFVVWLVSVSFAIFTFILEWIITFIGYMVFKKILLAFYHLRDQDARRVSPLLRADSLEDASGSQKQ